LETSKLASLNRDDSCLDPPVANDLAARLRSEASGLVELLAENGYRIERKLKRAKREDPHRTPERHFHLMVTSLRQKLEDPVTRDDLIFSYYTGAIATLLVGTKSLREDAIEITRMLQSAPSFTEAPFFKAAIRNVLPTKTQKMIRSHGLNRGNHTWAPGPTIVALGLLALIGAISVSAIFNYSTVDDALEFWSVLSGLVGVVTGAFVAFFFTRATVQAATLGTEALKGVAEKAQEQSDARQKAAEKADQQAQDAQKALATAMNLINDPE